VNSTTPALYLFNDCADWASTLLDLRPLELWRPRILAMSGYMFTFSNPGTVIFRRISGAMAQKMARMDVNCRGSQP
jgi:hypothetical protein